MKDKLFLIGSGLLIAAGALLAIFQLGADTDGPILIFIGLGMIIVGTLLLVTGFTTPQVAQSKEGVGLSYILIAASVLTIIGSLDVNALWMFPLIGIGLSCIVCFSWPCICNSGKGKQRNRIIGIANAHDQITMYELSQRTGLSMDVVRDIVYDALGNNQLHGKMESDTFIRSRPSSSAPEPPPSVTREREIVKVLVVCPYCGAKNEQGTPKCHKCQASL
ncbi:MAG: hypothetical protein GF411_15570 [Candidatus Lokiarchaeota archaeon]|nr:hypothetical protein [Candidatus Lokiarchaeota archaeon]